MDKVKNYVINGKPLSAQKIFLMLLGITGVLMILFAGVLWWSYHQNQVESLLQEVPVIEIQDGEVRQPTDTVWEKSFPSAGVLLRIDTTRDIPEISGKNGLFLGRKQMILLTSGQAETFPLPSEALTINRSFLEKTIRAGIGNLVLIVGCLCLFSLLIGYWGTVGLTHIMGFLIGRKLVAHTVRRSSFIGWNLILILDILLLLSGHGFTFPIAVLGATGISLLCQFYSIYRGNKTSA